MRHDTPFDDDLADNTLAVLEYDSALAIISSADGMFGHTYHRSFEIIGTDGFFTVQPIEPAPVIEIALRAGHSPYKKGFQTLQLAEQPRHIADFKDLARAIRTHAALSFSYDHELLVHETLLRASGMLEKT